MKKIIFTILIFVVASVIYFQFDKTNKEKPLSTDDYKNISYTIDGKSIKLLNGISQEKIPNSSSKITTRYFGNETTGDFDNNGYEDVAFIMSQDGSGSGIFFYATTALRQADGSYTGTNAIFLGDRISPQTTEFREGKIIINYADRKEGEPMATIPSIGVSKYLKIQDGVLVEIK